MKISPEGVSIADDDEYIEAVITFSNTVRKNGAPLPLDLGQENHVTFFKGLFGGLPEAYFPALSTCIESSTESSSFRPSLNFEVPSIGYSIEDPNSLYSLIKSSAPENCLLYGIGQFLYSYKPSGNLTPLGLSPLTFSNSEGTPLLNTCHTRRAFAEGKSLGLMSIGIALSLNGELFGQAITCDFKRVNGNYIGPLEVSSLFVKEVPSNWAKDFETLQTYYR